MKEINYNQSLKTKLIEKGQIRVKSFTVDNFINDHIAQIESLL